MKVLVRFLAYQLASWLALATVVRELGWFAPLVVLLIALYTTIPLLLFVRWRPGPSILGRPFEYLS